jgi:hypothetical protein
LIPEGQLQRAELGWPPASWSSPPWPMSTPCFLCVITTVTEVHLQSAFNAHEDKSGDSEKFLTKGVNGGTTTRTQVQIQICVTYTVLDPAELYPLFFGKKPGIVDCK